MASAASHDTALATILAQGQRVGRDLQLCRQLLLDALLLSSARSELLVPGAHRTQSSAVLLVPRDARLLCLLLDGVDHLVASNLDLGLVSQVVVTRAPPHLDPRRVRLLGHYCIHGDLHHQRGIAAAIIIIIIQRTSTRSTPLMNRACIVSPSSRFRTTLTRTNG